MAEQYFDAVLVLSMSATNILLEVLHVKAASQITQSLYYVRPKLGCVIHGVVFTFLYNLWGQICNTMELCDAHCNCT